MLTVGCGEGAGCGFPVVIEQVICRYREALTTHHVACNLLCSAALRLLRHLLEHPHLCQRRLPSVPPCAVIPLPFAAYTQRKSPPNGNPRVTTEWAVSLITCQFHAFWQCYCPS